MRFLKIFSVFLSGSLIVCSLGCEELLPPRDSPPEPFTVTVTPRYDYYPGSIASPPRNQIEFTIVVRNVYDETIQDTLDMFGKLQIECQTFDLIKSTITKKRSLDINLANMKSIKNYDRFSHVTILGPGDSIVIELNWNFIVDDTLNILDYIPSVKRGECDISTKQKIIATGFIHVMKNRSNITMRQTNFEQCFFVKTGVPACFDYIFNPCN